MKNLSLLVFAFLVSFCSYAIGPITGSTSVCVSTSNTLHDVTLGGTWTSSDVTVATVGLSTGTVTGVSIGTAMITYWVGTSDTTTVVTVDPTPAAISGASTICPEYNATLTDAVPGGTWSSDETSAVSIGSTTGVITAGASGMADIYYTMPGGCMVSKTVEVLPVSAITGPSVMCLLGTITLSDASGTWASSAPTIASVGTTGIVTGNSTGTATISYTDNIFSCVMLHPVTVSSGPAPITGTTGFCSNTNSVLADATGGGTWSSSDVSVATVTGGYVIGISGGTATIIYTTSCGAATTVLTLSVSPAPLAGLGTICVGGTTTVTESGSGGAWSYYATTSATFDSTTGLVTGLSEGEIHITYTLGDGCEASKTVNVTSSFSSISGPTSVCPGSSITLTDGTSGGSWISGNTAVGTVGSGSGIVTGIAIGTTIITYEIGTGCATYSTIIVGTSIAAIGGTTTICTAYPSTLTDATGGGTWSSSNTAIATVGSLTGVVTGVAAGTATIYYTTACGSASTIVTIKLSPAAISGATSLCDGSSETLTDATTGGTWSALTLLGATFGTITGIVTATSSSGEADIVYTIPDGCVASKTVTIMSTSSIMPISGPSIVCTSSTITLADYTSGGTWSSSNTAVATVTGAGLVTGVSAGTASIIYSVTETCGVVTSTQVVSVDPAVTAGTISGASSVYVSGASPLYETVSGGTWSSSNTSIATVGTTGIVTGIATGAATITYTVTGCSTAYTTYAITVTAIDGISGYVVFPSTYYGAVKVWLITYDPSTLMLEASDSLSVSCGSDSVYYQFTGLATDSFRVKAAVATFVGTGFIPTYHTSNFYWYNANVIYHTSGTSDVLKEIDMASGTSSGGPGFIGGNVTTGANRGTSGSVPAIGLTIYLLDASGAVVQQAITDGSGNYSFTGLTLGTYSVHPEAMNYVSTDYMGITLTTATESVSGINFIQHTVSMTITPGTTGINPVKTLVSLAETFPNPANTTLTIRWQELTDEKGTMQICDMTGREIYRSNLVMSRGTGTSQVDLTEIPAGLYLISVKSADINYVSKLQVQH